MYMCRSVYIGHKLTTLRQNFVALVILRESTHPKIDGKSPSLSLLSLYSTPMATAVAAAAHLTVLLTALLRQVHIMYL